MRRATKAELKAIADRYISIHALLAESDGGGFSLFYPQYRFLSTLSLRRATKPQPDKSHKLAISIHALLAESDVFGFCFSVFDFLFLSTLSLRRATYLRMRAGPTFPRFLSTLSLRRATISLAVPHLGKGFLSTLSLRRATPCHGRLHESRDYFYPRSPCGERR